MYPHLAETYPIKPANLSRVSTHDPILLLDLFCLRLVHIDNGALCAGADQHAGFLDCDSRSNSGGREPFGNHEACA